MKTEFRLDPKVCSKFRIHRIDVQRNLKVYSIKTGDGKREKSRSSLNLE